VQTTNDPKRGLRWWIPATIIALAVANIVRLNTSPDLDSMMKGMQGFFTIAVAVPLLLLWWLFLTRLRWRTRLIGFALILLCAVGLKLLVRMDNLPGSGKMRFVWAWTPRKTGVVGDLKRSSAAQERPEIRAALDYPGYLGRERSGVIKGLELERDWRVHPPQQLWRRPVGLGWSAFAVAGSRAITQEQRGQDELIVCYDLATGDFIWSHTNRVRFNEPMGGDGPRATPTIDGDRVFALGATGILDCLDAASGKLIWTHDTLKENALPNTYFGKSSSPLVIDELVVVTGGMTNSSTLLAFRREDGAPAWRIGKDQASFSSPMLATLAGRRHILSINGASVTGHDPKDGRTLWEYPWATAKWPKCAQPVLLDGDRIFVAASFNAGCALLQIKSASEGNFSVAELWKNRNLKSDFSNIVARDGFIYGLDDGILACLDIANGQRKWKDGRYGHGQLLLINDLLLVQTEQGPVALVEANPSAFNEVARFNALSAKTWNTPALAGEFLLVRNDQEAACFRLPARFPLINTSL